jgi:adenosylmethionine-8-amino-7-oxononanoate aminotransferase
VSGGPAKPQSWRRCVRLNSVAKKVPGPAALTGEHLLRPDVNTRSPVFTTGEGVELIDDQGRSYLDAASGVGVTCLGYGVDEIVRAMADQARELPYIHTLRFETGVVHRLADLIAGVAPGDLDYVFFVAGGSEANESAFKFARQYWLERGQPGRWRIIGRWPSFHGNTIATLSAGWHAARRKRHGPLLLNFPHIEAPNSYRGCSHCGSVGGRCTLACADELERTIVREGPDTIAGFIAEPVIGAAGGASLPRPDYFRRIREICDAHDILFIADEVITGFGRLGRWFGIERFDVQPDIITFAKGVSAGYAPLAGMIVRSELVDAFKRGSGRFEHNFTMAGHPIACAAGVATLSILRRDRLVERVAALEPTFFSALHRHLDDVPMVGDVRGLGLLAGVELVADRSSKRPFPPTASMSAGATRAAMDEGVIVYPCQGGVDGDAGDYLLLMPPFVSSEAELTEMAARLGRALRTLSES